MRFRRFLALYRTHFRDLRRERMFLASISFLITFGLARLLIHTFSGADEPFQLSIAGVHVHHLVWGILLILLTGYLWLIQVGTGAEGTSARLGRITALMYGVGAALTLDEFALWLHLEDVYWQPQGRASIDAVMVFSGLISAGLWGGPFLRGVARQAARVFRH